jgi:hypothetical protein
VEFQRKEEKMARREAMLKEEAMRQNPTSLQGRIGGLVDGDVEMGVRLR